MQNIIIANINSDLCPVFWLNKYITLANLISGSGQFLFSPIRYIKSSDSYIFVGQNCHIQELENFFSKP